MSDRNGQKKPTTCGMLFIQLDLKCRDKIETSNCLRGLCLHLQKRGRAAKIATGLATLTQEANCKKGLATLLLTALTPERKSELDILSH